MRQIGAKSLTIYFVDKAERNKCHLAIVKEQGFSCLIDQYHVKT